MPGAIELEIEKMIYGGDGLARTEGKSVFVPFVLPGERITAELTQAHRSFARAEITAIQSPSPHRIAPGCPYFGECGGCHYQHADYAAQLAIKHDVFIEALRRIGRIELEVPLQSIPSPEPWHYRNRTRLHIEQRPAFRMGYYRAGSHALLDIEQCPISSPLLNRALSVVRQLGSSSAVPRSATEIELFANAADQQCLIELYTTEANDRNLFETFAEQLRSSLPECAGVHLFFQSPTSRGAVSGVSHLCGSGASALEYEVGEGSFRVSAGGFFQVNRLLIERFAELVVADAHGKRALDLYSGAGLFAVRLSERFREVLAVEVSPPAYGDLEANLAAKNRTFRLTTESFLRDRAKLAAGCELAVVDPPRAGLGAETARLLANAAPRHITYVSCDPATLARDLRVLIESGYRIGEALLVDMFPQTFHIESVIRLRSSRHES